MPGSNYPPGTSAGDPRAPWNQPDRSHEHEWAHDEQNLSPEIEDGAAIFHEQCMYAEGRYGDGWSCEEERYYRFEYSWLETPKGDEIELPTVENWDEVNEKLEHRVITIETAYRSGDASIDVDPDPDYGIVTISYDGYTLNYEPQ